MRIGVGIGMGFQPGAMGGGGTPTPLATTYTVNPTDTTHATIRVAGRLASPVTITPDNGSPLTPVEVPAGEDQTAVITYSASDGQTLTFTNDGGLADPDPLMCPNYFIDPRGSGDGSSAANAMPQIVTAAAGKTYSFAEVEDDADPIVHTLPGTAMNSHFSINAANVRFETHHATAAGARRRKTYFSGARDVAGTFSATTVNGVSVYSYAFGSAQEGRNHFVIDRKPTYATRCAPNSDDSAITYNYISDMLGFQPGMEGFAQVAAADVSATLNTTSKISIDTTAKTIRFKAPNFWAAINAIQSPVGLPIIYRGGANHPYEATITSYDAVNGLVEASYPSSAPTYADGLFYWGLQGHPGAIVKDGQYGWSADRTTMYLRWDADDLTALASSRRLYTFRQLLLLTLNPGGPGFLLNPYGQTVLADAAATAVTTSRIGGVAFQAPSGGCGDIIARNIQANVQSAGAGVDLGSSVAAVYSCGTVEGEMDLAGYLVRAGSTNGVQVDIARLSGGHGVRLNGNPSDDMLVDGQVTPPHVSIHTNPITTTDTAQNTVRRRCVVAGSLNPLSHQYNFSTGLTTATSRTYDRIMACALAPMDGGATYTNNAARFDNGMVGNVLDRMLVLGEQTSFGVTASNFHDMTIKRGFLAGVASSSATSTHFDGTVFEDMVFGAEGAAGSGVIAYLEARGATCTNCVEDASGWQGSLTEAMWQRFTTNDTRDGYEDVAFFPAHLGLADIPAWNAELARSINPLGIACRPLEAGMQSGLHVATILNPNPMTTLALPAGVEDNDLFASTLWGNYALRLGTRLPAQASYTLAVDVTDLVSDETTRQTLALPVMT